MKLFVTLPLESIQPWTPGSAGWRTNACFSRGARSLQQLWRWISGGRKPRSVLASHINLPFWIASSLALSLVCNFALRENTAQAARLMGSHVSVTELQELLRQMPDSYVLHVRLGDAYAEEGNFRRAMFHFQEANRFVDGAE